MSNRSTIGVLALSAGSALTALPVAGGLLLTLGTYVTGQLHGQVYHADFLNYYSAARMWLDAPETLYHPAIERAFQQQLAGGRDVYDQFWSLPYLALLFSPLALLPYGVAYVVWLAANLLCLAGAVYTLAPARPGRWFWLVSALVYPPVAAALLDGQTSLVALGAFAFAVRCASAWPLAGWLLKPQLLPVPLLALVLSRRLRVVLAITFVALGLSAVVLLRAGPTLLASYLALSAAATQATRDRSMPPGQTVLGLAQSLVGPGDRAALLALALGGILWLLVAALWWGGLRPDARRWLQLALLPLAAVLTAARAGPYELATWLASGWLLLRYAGERPGARPVVLVALALGWWGGTLTVLFVFERGFEWGALAGLALCALVAGQYARDTRSQRCSRVR